MNFNLTGVPIPVKMAIIGGHTSFSNLRYRKKNEGAYVRSALTSDVFTSYVIIQIACYSKFMQLHGNILQ